MYDPSKIFRSYIDEKQHTSPQRSQALANDYVKGVTVSLTEAYNFQLQLSHVGGERSMTKPEKIALAADALGTTSDQLVMAVSAAAGTSRSASPSPSKRARVGEAPSEPAASGGRGVSVRPVGQAPSSLGGPLRAAYDKVVQTRPDLEAGQIVKPPDGVNVKTAIEEGACLICLRKGHGCTRCPIDTPDARVFKELFRAFLSSGGRRSAPRRNP